MYFARVVKEKGIEDLLQAMTLLIKYKPNIKLLIIGKANKAYTKILTKYIVKNKLEKSIKWVGFLPSISEVHRAASSARISVLPTYNELISGTIIESLFLRIPVVAYDVGSIHELNAKEEIISLVGKGNIYDLVQEILYLLQNPACYESRAYNGYKRALELFHNRSIVSDLSQAYRDVIRSFKNI